MNILSIVFTFFLSLALPIQIIFSAGIIFFLYLLIFKRNIAIKWGKLALGFSKNDKRKDCFDCIKMLNVLQEQYRTKHRTLIDCILQKQMNNFELESELITSKLCTMFREAQLKNAATDNNSITKRSDDYKIFRYMLKIAMEDVRSAWRRASKENGYSHMLNLEFINYKQDQSTKLLSIIKDFIINDYPTNITPNLDEFSKFDFSWIIEKFKLLYDNCKEIVINIEKEIQNLDAEFDKEIKELIISK
jgi:hypothetical protein